jgi:hypothetical protein
MKLREQCSAQSATVTVKMLRPTCICTILIELVCPKQPDGTSKGQIDASVTSDSAAFIVADFLTGWN